MRAKERLDRSNLTAWTQALVTFSIIGALLFLARNGYNSSHIQTVSEHTVNQAQQIGLATNTVHVMNFSEQFPIANTAINWYIGVLCIVWFVVIALWIAKTILLFSEK